ncbi:hypothetical protein AB0H83_29125 [Dactylosporangium sp. NPDC050688]|uniref:hypothetical protein n=1 Tax=Dactylosporangium sp. NPDC050688 TaxID=3157217 RepID=UPI0034057909
MRKAVEQDRWSLRSVVEIGLPAGCFTEPGGTGVRIMDLPGVSATNAAEDRHARHLIDTWINVSDLVILVTRVDRLSPLRPSALRVQALRNWPRQLGRLRVVLTHTYSDQETLTWMEQQRRGRTAAAGRRDGTWCRRRPRDGVEQPGDAPLEPRRPDRRPVRRRRIGALVPGPRSRRTGALHP